MSGWIPLDPHPLEGQVKCSCGTPARLFTTKKANQNLNRQFFTCPKDRDDTTRCSFWKWADELSGPGAPAVSQTGLASPPASQPGNDTPGSSQYNPPATPSNRNVNRNPATPGSASRANRSTAQEVRRIALLEWSLGTNHGSRPGALSSSTPGTAVVSPRMSEQSTVYNRSNASTISDLDHDEMASMGAPPLPPWPTPTNARPRSPPSTCSGGTILERGSPSKRKREEDEESDDPFARPSSSSAPAKRPLFATSRIERLEKRVTEAETKIHEQQATIEQQNTHLERQNAAFETSEAANRILQGRLDRLEMHVVAMKSRLELHNQLLYDSPPE